MASHTSHVGGAGKLCGGGKVTRLRGRSKATVHENSLCVKIGGGYEKTCWELIKERGGVVTAIRRMEKAKICSPLFLQGKRGEKKE